MLVHVVRGDSEDPVGDFIAINQELELFNPKLALKTQVRRGMIFYVLITIISCVLLSNVSSPILSTPLLRVHVAYVIYVSLPRIALHYVARRFYPRILLVPFIVV